MFLPSSPHVPVAYDAFACARVPQCELHLWVCVPVTLPLYALGTLHTVFSSLSVSLILTPMLQKYHSQAVLCNYIVNYKVVENLVLLKQFGLTILCTYLKWSPSMYFPEARIMTLTWWKLAGMSCLPWAWHNAPMSWMLAPSWLPSSTTYKPAYKKVWGPIQWTASTIHLSNCL